MQNFLDDPVLNKIKKLKGHAKSKAIESFVEDPNGKDEKVSILIYALDDADYSFCMYETCVKSAAAYLYDLRECLTSHIYRKNLLKILIDDLDVNFSNTDDNLDRVKLLGTFRGEAKSTLHTLKSALSEYGDGSEYSNEKWYKDSFEYKCRSTLKNAIHLIESDYIA